MEAFKSDNYALILRMRMTQKRLSFHASPITDRLIQCGRAIVNVTPKPVTRNMVINTAIFNTGFTQNLSRVNKLDKVLDRAIPSARKKILSQSASGVFSEGIQEEEHKNLPVIKKINPNRPLKVEISRKRIGEKLRFERNN